MTTRSTCCQLVSLHLSKEQVWRKEITSAVIHSLLTLSRSSFHSERRLTTSDIRGLSSAFFKQSATILYTATRYEATTTATGILPQAIHGMINGGVIHGSILLDQCIRAVEHLHDQHPKAVHILQLHHSAALLVDVRRALLSTAVADKSRLDGLTSPHIAPMRLLSAIALLENGGLEGIGLQVVVVDSQPKVAYLHHAVLHHDVLILPITPPMQPHFQVVMDDVLRSGVGQSLSNGKKNSAFFGERVVSPQILR